MDRDVTIFYLGGSGGFCLFYYLLLSGKYQTGFDHTDYGSMAYAQFPDSLIEGPSIWKSKELWPDNLMSKQSRSTKPKLYLVCNPDSTEGLDQYIHDTHHILLYTDMKLQMRMSYEKKAFWFWIPKEDRETFFARPDLILQSDYAFGKFLYTIMPDEFSPELDSIRTNYDIDQEVRLEDFVNTKTISNFDPPNEQQLNFLKHWYDIQPPKCKRLIDRC